MTYKDMTFCSSKKCINKNCDRHKDNVPKDLPSYILVAYSDFTDVCKDIIRKKV